MKGRHVTGPVSQIRTQRRLEHRAGYEKASISVPPVGHPPRKPGIANDITAFRPRLQAVKHGFRHRLRQV